MTLVHIYTTPCHYIGQIKRRGAHKWVNATTRCPDAKTALANAVLSMTDADHRARVLMIDESNCYDPLIVMKANK